MPLTLEHNGHTLTFRESDESWSCGPMRMEAKSLKALKAKLDKHDGQARKVTVPVYLVDHYGRSKAAQIVMIAKPKDWDRSYAGIDSGTRVPSVWVVQTNGNRSERSKVRLDACVAATKDNLTEITMAEEMLAEAKAFEAKARKIIADIPRMTVDDLIAKGAVEDNLEATDG